jgi:hypothetical protein
MGPYLSERQWGTVREDYSENGNAWDYFSHDQARSRAYHWGEDGLAGISDDKQRLCFALALWNGKDPILKERLFGLTNSEGNHGEDVKEYYFYLDSTPTHSYMKYLYKYPQAAYPYDHPRQRTWNRSATNSSTELIDTGIFDNNRNFDVFVEYRPRESPEDILVPNQYSQSLPGSRRAARGAHALVPQPLVVGQRKPAAIAASGWTSSCVGKRQARPQLGERHLYCDGQASLLFTEMKPTQSGCLVERFAHPSSRDGYPHDFIVRGQPARSIRRRPARKAAAQYQLTVPARKVRNGSTPADEPSRPDANREGLRQSGRRVWKHFADVLESRRKEADELYAERDSQIVSYYRRGQCHAPGAGRDAFGRS